MRVLQVLPDLDSGGVEKGTLEIAKALVSSGHESWVASAGGRLVDQLEAEGSHHAHWPIGRKSLRTLAWIRPFAQWLTEKQFDIVHVRSRLPAWITLCALRMITPARRPHLITTVHGLNSVSRYSSVLTRGERVITVSKTCHQFILDHYPSVDPARLTIIPRGIDPQEWPTGYKPSAGWMEKWSAEYPSLQDRPLVTLPGRLTRLKGHEDFLKIITRLKPEHPDIAGLIVGGAAQGKENYESELRSKVRKLGLENTIYFTGHRADIREIYSVSDVVMSLSTKPESFGRTVLEPLALGVPVVGYNRGGVGEILEALFPSGAVAPGDIQRATEAIDSVLNGHTVPVRKNTTFLLGNMQEQTLKLYEEITGS